MKRIALIAGVSIATLVCAGPTAVHAAPCNVDSWWGRLQDSRAARAAGPSETHQAAPPSTEKSTDRKVADKTPGAAFGPAARHRLDRQAARDAVRRRRAGRQHRDVDRAPPAIRRRPACSRSSRRTGITSPISTMRRCPTCSASPGRAPRCTRGPCPAIRRRTAASGCTESFAETALEDDQDGRARHHHSRRGRADDDRARPAVRADAAQDGHCADRARCAGAERSGCPGAERP